MRIYILMFFMLSACSKPQVVTEPLIAKVPVAVSCHARVIAPPDWNRNHVTENATSVEKLKAVLADRELSEGYEKELEAELQACS